jgi:hypothetical protein
MLADSQASHSLGKDSASNSRLKASFFPRAGMSQRCGEDAGNCSIQAIQYGRIDSPRYAKSAPDYPFERVPKPNSVQQGIEKIGQYAVMTILRIGVVAGMVPRGLNKPDALKQRNEGPVLAGRAMCPLMDLVGIDAKNYD